MSNSGKDQDREAADRPALDPERMPDFSEAIGLNPLMVHPAAAMAAATAIGFGFASQMASAFFGALHGVMETSNRQKPADAAGAATAPVATSPVEKPGVSDVVVAEPAAAVIKSMPTIEKPKAKPVRKVSKPEGKTVEPVMKAEAPATETIAEPASKVVAKTVVAKAPAKAATKPSASVAKPVSVKQPAKTKAAAKVAVTGGDLKRISGIGPKLEGVLNRMDVTSLAQVAAWTDADIESFDKELGFEGRIGRDDWVGQAKALLK